MKFASYIDVRCWPTFLTYPSCKLVLGATSCSRETFHCREFGRKPPVDLLALGDTDALVKGLGVSMDRLVLTPMTPPMFHSLQFR
jgi:hypothetical protein